jgi:hypothetical protein
MAKLSKVDRAKQFMDRGRLSKSDFGVVAQMGKSASARAGFGGLSDSDGENEMPGAQDEEQDQAEGDETVSPEMMKAGLAALKASKGKKPADCVRAIWAAMEAAEPPEPGAVAGPQR